MTGTSVLEFLRARRALTALLLSAALVASGCGATATTSTETTDASQSDDHGDHDDDHGDHSHGGGLEVPSDMAVPDVAISIVEDPMSGQNLTVTLTDFEVTPALASTPAVNGGGHLHLYVNGERTAPLLQRGDPSRPARW